MMDTNRLEAFSDGVLAIIITIMVLEMKIPHGTDFDALWPLWPVFLSYILSFVYIGIYWNNHHHMLHAAQRVNGSIMWANSHLLFWLSLVPFATGWMGENHFAPVPTALYGAVLLMAAIARNSLSNCTLFPTTLTRRCSCPPSAQRMLRFFQASQLPAPGNRLRNSRAPLSRVVT